MARLRNVTLRASSYLRARHRETPSSFYEMPDPTRQDFTKVRSAGSGGIDPWDLFADGFGHSHFAPPSIEAQSLNWPAVIFQT